MTSILTNTAAMAALQTLRTIGIQLTQTQISSGHKSREKGRSGFFTKTVYKCHNRIEQAAVQVRNLQRFNLNVASYGGGK